VERVFESDRIEFVKVDESLVGDYLTMVNDIERVGRLIGRRTEPIPPEKELRWVRSKREENAPIWSMIEKTSGAFIGNIELMDVHDGEGELGIAITAEKQDRGFGKEAIPAALGYAKTTLGLKRVFLKVYPDNPRAFHVYEVCGFREYDRNDEDIFMEIAL